jgi:phage terminase large subunit
MASALELRRRDFTAGLYYHERKDETRDVGLGPDHDWSSQCADAFGLMAIHYEEPSKVRRFGRSIEYPQWGVV